jgi:hypothetical protein
VVFGGKFLETNLNIVIVVINNYNLGHNNDEERKRMFVNSVAILDTKTRIWTSPIITGIPPSRRGFAAAGLLDDKHLVVAFGNSLPCNTKGSRLTGSVEIRHWS